MDKSRAKRENHDKIRMSLIALVAIFSVSICVLGSMIGYKIYTKQSFEQKIESLKKEKDDQLSEGNQKDHFRKGQAEVIAYYPLQGEQVISSVKAFTLDQLFSDASKAKEQLIKELTSFLQDKKLEQEKVDQLVKVFSDQDLSAWNFDYKDSQILIYPSQPVENLDEIALPVSSFFEVIQSSYLLDKDAELYKAYYEKKNRKVVALTFDDGPNPTTTNQALDILSKYGIKATFFVLGKNVSGNEEILKRMKADGHVIGNHSWSHPVLSKLSLDEAKKQITDTEDALTKVLGSSSKLMRPPYGAITDDIRNSLDLSFIMWDVDSLDWKSKNEAAILTEIQREVKNGSIILMHDIHAETVNALPKVIDYLKGQGYDFVTIPDLLDTRLKPHQLYYDRDQ